MLRITQAQFSDFGKELKAKYKVIAHTKPA